MSPARSLPVLTTATVTARAGLARRVRPRAGTASPGTPLVIHPSPVRLHRYSYCPHPVGRPPHAPTCPVRRSPTALSRYCRRPEQGSLTNETVQQGPRPPGTAGTHDDRFPESPPGRITHHRPLQAPKPCGIPGMVAKATAARTGEGASAAGQPLTSRREERQPPP